MKVVLAGLLLALCAGCGGGDDDGEQFAIYHLETAIGQPKSEGELRCGPPRPSRAASASLSLRRAARR